MILEEKNTHERDKHIRFEEEGHIYTIKGDTSYISTTTWVKTFFEEFNSDLIIEKMMNSINWKNNKYYGKSKDDIKNEWSTQGKLASELGTKLHQDIENFYNELDVDNDSLEFSYFKNFHHDNSDLIPFRTEWYVWDEELKICGSIDMIFQNSKGELIIYDWKRCKEIKKSNSWGKTATEKIISHIVDTNFWHYALQLNIYKAILEKNYGYKVPELYIVCLHPNNTNNNYQKYKIPDLQEEVKKLFSDRFEEINTVEVEGKEKDGIIYLVDINNNIYSEEGEIIGIWSDE